MSVTAVLFDFSGTLFRLEEDDSWFAGMQVDERAVDGHVQAELMRRLTAPTGRSVEMMPRRYRGVGQPRPRPHLHREAYLHVLRESGLTDHHAESLYRPRRSTRPVLDALPRHRRTYWPACTDRGVRTRRRLEHRLRRAARVPRRSARPRRTSTEFVLSFEVGAVKPNPEIFQTALTRLGVDAA